MPTCEIEVKGHSLDTWEASLDGLAATPEVSVTVAPAKPTKHEIRAQLKLLKQAAKLNLSAARAKTVVGEALQVADEVKAKLKPWLLEKHGSWLYSQFDRGLVAEELSTLALMGFYWSQHRNGWRRPGLGSQGGSGLSLNAIRSKYGCERL